MQKKLLTAAVAGALAMPVAAFAQVTLFGTIDTGIRNQSKISFAGGDESEMVVTDGLRTTNRWGFRGSEDLGGGLMANFWFEGQYSSDTGGGPGAVGNTYAAPAASHTLFARQNWVGLSKGGMDLRLGRDYTVNFKTQGIYDPMSYTYTGITPTAGTNTQGVRFSNLVSAGFRFGTGGIRVDYTMGETVGADTGDGFGINGDFAFGPVTVAAAFSTVEQAGGTSNDVTNIGARYVMGAFTFRAGWSNTENESTNSESPMYVLGVQYAISPTLNARLGYYNLESETASVTTQERKQMIVALDYYLSKRTTAYVAYDRLDLMTGTLALGGAQVGPLLDGASGISVGIAHSF
jgi:predicted porin